MTRAAIVAALCAALLGGAYWAGGIIPRQEAEALRGQLEAQRRIEDARDDIRSLDDHQLDEWLRDRIKR